MKLNKAQKDAAKAVIRNMPEGIEFRFIYNTVTDEHGFLAISAQDGGEEVVKDLQFCSDFDACMNEAMSFLKDELGPKFRDAF